ncbi:MULTISPECIES: hypothetical protein [unclassified Streptomyces]|uniref:hypothetical protein n=1 Tax=unclassified Streptomyces TaxID=2593676 RepID=UPI0033B4F1CD
MLLEQNAALQRTLHEVQNELRTLRAHELGARLRDGLNARSLRDTEIQDCARNETPHSQPAAKQRPPSRHSATSTSG